MRWFVAGLQHGENGRKKQKQLRLPVGSPQQNPKNSRATKSFFPCGRPGVNIIVSIVV